MPTQENQPIHPSQKQVGYFRHLKIGEKHIGGILVTNQIGIPLEFKYTDPLVATKLHKILYGSVLEKYLHESVIRDRLAKEIRSTPAYFITPYEEKQFLGAIADKEVLAIQRYPSVSAESSGFFTRVREREAIIELHEEAIVLRVAFSTSDDVLQHRMAAWLQEIAGTMDILEPLDRINSALTSLCGDGKKD